jgi:hypothetical protein
MSAMIKWLSLGSVIRGTLPSYISVLLNTDGIPFSWPSCLTPGLLGYALSFFGYSQGDIQSFPTMLTLLRFDFDFFATKRAIMVRILFGNRHRLRMEWDLNWEMCPAGNDGRGRGRRRYWLRNGESGRL